MSSSFPKFKWGEFSDTDEELELDELNEKIRHDKDVVDTSCCLCLSEADPERFLGLCDRVLELNSMDCHINGVREVVNKSMRFYDDFNENSRLNVLNNILKLRHNSLSKYLAKTLGLQETSTDIKFSDIFGIPSERTPDFIEKIDGDKYLILEVSAVSDVEKAHRMKGTISKGYLSKYNKELELLKKIGVDVHYSTVIFNMSDPQDRDYQREIDEIQKISNRTCSGSEMFDLELMKTEWITQTHYLYSMYSGYLGILFGTPYSLAKPVDLLELDFIGEPIKKYSGDYMRVGISSSLYDKVNSNMPRFFYMAEKVAAGDQNADLILKFDMEKQSFYFSIDKKAGKPLKDWIDRLNHDNKVWVCENLEVVYKSSPISKIKAEFEFFEYQKMKKQKGGYNEQSDYAPTHRKKEITDKIPLKDFTKRIVDNHFLQLECVFEDEDYESELLSAIKELDDNCTDAAQLSEFVGSLSFKPLCSHVVNEASLSTAVAEFSDELKKKNMTGENIKLFWAKPPFLYPIAQLEGSDYSSYNIKPTDILSKLGDVNLGEYTNKLVQMVKSEGFIFGTTRGVPDHKYEAAKMKISNFSKRVLADLKDLHLSRGKGSKFPKMLELPNGADLKIEIANLNRELHKVAGEQKIVNKNIGLVKMGRGVKSLMNKSFKTEMSHFKNNKTKSYFKGVGLNFNEITIDGLFDTLKRSLLSPADSKCIDDIYDDTVSADNKLLKQLKTQTIEESKPYSHFLANTNLYHSCNFISRMCHALMFHSQTAINSSYVAVDNLGYNNVLLFVKGGKKIFKTKRSKLFRMIYPTFDSVESLYFPPGLDSSFSSFYNKGRTYLVTPWMNMHETLISDGLTMLHRCMGFAVMNRVPELDHMENLDRVYFNIILSIHNRRQTETMLHNLRYVFMNCLSNFSAITEILPELAGFNYDMFQCWLRHGIKDRFFTFSKKLLELHRNNKRGALVGLNTAGITHIFNRNPIKDVHTLALGIYSSYLMSKAATTQTLEQVKNLKSMMGVHDEFESEKGEASKCYTVMKKGVRGYGEALFESDFNFDPKYCFLLGKFMGDYLKSMTTKSKLSQKWDSILDRNWDNLANTKGLRGKGQDFFGNKGYYVVYKTVLGDKKSSTTLLETLKSDMDPIEKEKIIKQLNESSRDRIGKEPLDCVVFHVVDKVQRGGSREIFVMDMETKVHQQVIEEFMKHTCKLIPNEMISIPSNKRLSNIHSKVFEDSRDHNEKFYWVLDCRKWAPKSMIEKFMIFLMGAKHMLPETFFLHAMNFFTLLRKKKIYTRPHVFEIMTKSEANSGFKKYFHLDENNKAYYFEAKYSWVMGIFNYFSSLMHVANQLHISHLIKKSSLENLKADNILHMVAHSDDSAGKIMVDNHYQHMRASLIYEIFMHSANHLLSKKKCNQGQVYYEFISILYIGGVLLSLLAKFTGIFNFHPTDKGYCSDITDAYSKSTEMLLNGATFEQCYIAMKIQTHLIYRFYFSMGPPKSAYDLPPAMFGAPDSHPLMVLLCGSDADLFRLFQHGGKDSTRLISVVNKVLLPIDAEYNGVLKSFTCTPNVKLNKKMERLVDNNQIPQDLLESWSLKNVKFMNTVINGLQFIMKLKDKTFLASMQDESMTRRISRAYYFRSHLTIATQYGDMTPREMKELLFLTKRALTGDVGDLNELASDVILKAKAHLEEDADDTDEKKIFDFLFHEIIRMDDYMSQMFYNNDMIQDYKKNCKPVYISLQRTVEENPIDYNPQALCSWIKEPQFRMLLPDTRGFNTAETFLNNTLQKNGLNSSSMTPDQLFPIIQKLKAKSKSEYFCYSNVPSQMREISTYQDLLNYLAHNSFKDKYIQGLGIQFQKSMGTQLKNINEDLDDDDFQHTLSLITLINALMTADDFKPEMFDLRVKRPLYLGGGISNFKELINDSIKHWEENPKYSVYMKFQVITYRKLADGLVRFNADEIYDTLFHSFIKRQQLVDNVWLGQGKIFVSVGKLKMVLIVVNIRVEKVVVQNLEHVFDRTEVAYLNIVLKNSQLPFLQENMVTTEIEDFDNFGLCVDQGNNYYIGDTRGSIRHLPAIFDQTLSTPLSQPSRGRIKPSRRGRVVWECSQDGKDYQFVVNVLPVEVQNSVLILRGCLVDDLYNKNILSDKDSSAVNLMIEVCADVLELERSIDFGNVLKNYPFSQLYSVIKKSNDLQLCTAINPPIRQTNFPAADGGLLNLFVAYSRFDAKFDFRWQRTISPEYMALKSTQPEAFMSEFVETMRAKYDSLYTADDKKAIHSSMMHLSESIAEGDQEEKLLNLLCTWGYAGVAGALNELSEDENVTFFEKVRAYNKTAAYLILFAESFPVLITNIFETYKYGLGQADFVGVEGKNSSNRITPGQLNMHRMSFMHANTLMLYTTGTPVSFSYSEDYLLVFDMLESVIANEKTRSFFKNLNKKSMILRSLPTDVRTMGEWKMTLRSLQLSFQEQNRQNITLDFTIRLDRSDNILNPYVFTRDILAKGGLTLNAKKVFHYGAISSHYYDYLTQQFKESYKNEEVFFSCSMVKHGDFSSLESVWLNPGFHFDHVLDQEFLESDYFYDAYIELQSDEPDIDAIEEAISEYESESGKSIYFEPEIKRKRVKIVVNGKLKNMIKCNLKIVMTFGGGLTQDILGKLRQVGEDVILVTNILPFPLLQNENIMCFRNENTAWKGLSIMDPRSIYYIIITNDFKDARFWERVLSCRHVTGASYSAYNTPDFFSYRAHSGNIDTLSTITDANEAWMKLEEGIKARMKDEEEKERAKVRAESSGGMKKVMDEKISKLKDDGLDDEQITKYKKLADLSRGKRGWEDVFNVLSGMAEKAGDINKTESKMLKKLDKLIESQKDPIKHEMIMQVPRTFGGGRRRDKVIRNTLFRETKIIAELESFCPGLIWKVLSGSLYISEKTYTLIKQQIMLYKKFLKICTKHKKGKQFMINLCTLILNDAVVVDIGDEVQGVWESLLNATQKFILLDEDEEEDDDDIMQFANEPLDVGILNYKISGTKE